MKRIKTEYLSTSECWGVQINGLNHCKNINCKWQGLSACEGKRIISTGFNEKGYKIGMHGIEIPNAIDTKKPG